MPDVLLERRDDHVAIVTLNRPERMNAITYGMIEELTKVLLELDRDPTTRAVILTGAGRGFCSGLDLKEAAAGKGIAAMGISGGAAHIATRDLPTVVLQQMDVPVVCAINGAAAGYGLDLALGCDMRIMADTATLLPGFAKRGIVPESGGTWYLPKLVGWATACEIGFIADDIPAARAHDLRLVNAVVPAADLITEALAWTSKIAANAPLAIRAMKRLYRHGQTEDFESHSHHVLMQLLTLFRSNDFREGIAAFMERRAPRFEGR